MLKVGVLGLGKMGEALTRGLLSSPQVKCQVQGTVRNAENAARLHKELNISVGTDNLHLVKENDVILLGVKPFQAEKTLKEIAPLLDSKKLLVSICAGITTGQIESWIQNRCPVIRSMPNTPAVIRQAMSVLCIGKEAKKEHLKIAQDIFSSIGKTAVLEEALMDAATGLSGCGPAYAFLIIEGLSEGGVKVGLSRKQATLMAAQTLMGAAQMVMERGNHPAELKDEVTTPAGCTIDGLLALEEGNIRVALVKAIVAAKNKSEQLKNQSS